MKSIRNPSRRIAVALLLILLPFTPAYSATRSQNPVPLVNSPLVPDSIAPGSQSFLLTVNGTGFVSGSVVNWNDTPLATTFVSASQLTATVPDGNVAASGTTSVTVTNPAPGGGGSNVALFSVRTPFPTASFDQHIVHLKLEPYFVTTSDLNVDGKADLVVTYPRDAKIGVLLGEGDGTFRSPVSYRVADGPFAVIAADLNGDNKLDLAVCTGSAFLSVLVGNGDGTFQKHVDFPVSNSQGVSMVAGDFNGDGRLDLAIVLHSGQVAIVLGNGDGSFQPAVNYSAASQEALGIAIGDFNRDGNLDLAVAAESDSFLSILLGNGDGTFQNAVGYPTQAAPASVVAGDFDGDGNLDLATQTQFDWITVLLGAGDGTFFTRTDYPSARGFFGITAADLSAHGSLDLLVPNFGPDTLSTFTNHGDGTFEGRNDFATGDGPESVAVADFDSDGRLDLAVADFNETSLSLMTQVVSVLSRTYLKFGNVKVGEKSTRKVTLSNIGDNAFRINGIVLAGKSKDGYEVSNNCDNELAPGANCKITIVFTPTLPRPYRQARVKVNDGIAKQKIYLTGSGVK
jgi:hypothetical protein